VAALELAFMLPIFLALCTSVWDMGRAIQQMERLHHGVRAAVRHLATGNAADATRQDEARRLAVYGRLDGGTTAIVPGLQLSMVSILEPQSTPGMRLVSTAAGPVSLVTVQISGVRFEPLLLPAIAGFTYRPISLTLAYRFG
jgi:Flp pilus assembly protein TadG